jgi:hypothetical protein
MPRAQARTRRGLGRRVTSRRGEVLASRNILTLMGKKG